MLQKTYLPAMQEHFELFFNRTAGLCQPVLDSQQLPVDPDYRSDIAHTKRFLELWTADAQFRTECAADPVAAVQARGLQADPERIRRLWDGEYAREAEARGEPLNLSVLRYRAFTLEKLLFRDRLREQDCAPRQPRWRLWRERQINRVFSELGEPHGRAIVHAPFAIELTKGCSVGCWFCGLDAGKKEADFLYTAENASLWRDTLHVLQDLMGPNAWTGFLYWATDPLDNPDYERFCFDYADILGCCPQTTTAQPQQHIERLRPFLRESADRGCRINRFSILSLGMMRKVHAAFSAEELLCTELITQNAESNSMLSKAGRSKDSVHLQRKAKRLGLDLDQMQLGTISCVSGFLINMVERTAQLVAPCRSSSRWPMGYWVYEEGPFTTADDLADLLQGMIDRHLPDALTHRDPIAFRPDLSFEETADSIVLTSPFMKTTLHPREGMQPVGRLVAHGDLTAGELAFAAEATDGIPLGDTFQLLDILFQNGLLDEDPAFFHAKRDLP